MATDDREIFRILAKHVNWSDEGDRQTVAEYFGRDADDPDAFRPFDQEDDDRTEAENRDNQTDADRTGRVDPNVTSDDNKTDADKQADKPSRVTPLTTAKSPTRR